jgi:Uma2 family endonuclease
MSTATLLAVEQFEQLPDQDGVQFELKDGMLVATANAEWRHEQTKAEILSCLVPHVVQYRLGRVYAETAFAISPSRVYTPDISFLEQRVRSKRGSRTYLPRSAGPGNRGCIGK